jgi:hypothetical protein
VFVWQAQSQRLDRADTGSGGALVSLLRVPVKVNMLVCLKLGAKDYRVGPVTVPSHHVINTSHHETGRIKPVESRGPVRPKSVLPMMPAWRSQTPNSEGGLQTQTPLACRAVACAATVTRRTQIRVANDAGWEQEPWTGEHQRASASRRS